MSLDMNNENPILKFYVGVWVGGHPRVNLSCGSKDAQENFASFDGYKILAAERGENFYMKNW